MFLPEKCANAKRRARRLARVLACGVLVFLPACRIPGLRNADPGPVLPVTYPAGLSGAAGAEHSAPLAAVVGGAGVAVFADGPISFENSAQLGVNEFFQDPVLQELLSNAQNGNRELRIQAEEIQVASFEILSRQGAYLPTATIGGGVGVEKPSRYTRDGAVEDELFILPEKRFPNPLWNFSVGAVNLSVPLDIWRQYRNARDAAIQRYLAATERRNYTVTRVIAETAENYYRLMALDQRLENLDRTIALQEQSLEVAKAKKAAGRGTELAVQRFEAEVRRNQGEKLVVRQEIVEVENRINYLVNRFPERVERNASGFFDLAIPPLKLGVPAQLLQNRPDIRQAERDLVAAGLDVQVARARFFPSVNLTAGVGYEAFNPRYLFNTPQALAYNLAGDLSAPLINRTAIRADYLSANARQLQSLYNYQRVILNAVTEVVNRMSMVENYTRSIEYRRQQLAALEASVESATRLFNAARAEYIEVLFAQRDLREARTELIEAKWRQLSAVINTYQALGGGSPSPATSVPGFGSSFASDLLCLP